MGRESFSMVKFSARLKELRVENDMTLEELCDRLYMKYQYKTNKGVISRYENGRHEPNLYFVDIASDFFGVSMDYLSGKSESRYSRPEEKKCNMVPIIGVIAAGEPILAQENIEGYECVPETKRVDYCLRVKGDSMTGARILDGDLVYIRKQPDVENGEIAVVLIDAEEATLKRVFKLNGSLIIHAENPNYPDRIFTKKDAKEVAILGKAVFFKSEVR